MSLNLSDIERGLREMRPHYERRAAAGLRVAAFEAEELLRDTTAHGDVTGATRAGYTAAVITPQDDGSGALAAAVAAVEAENPGRSATATGTLAGSVGMVLYSPTDYQADLEASQKATLGPTLAAIADDLTRRAARGQ